MVEKERMIKFLLCLLLGVGAIIFGYVLKNPNMPLPIVSAKENAPDPGPRQKIITMLVTGYCPCEKCCGKYADGRTANNKDASLPGVSADPSLLPYGTKLDIPGIGIREVDDTGGAMRRNGKKGILHIDVRFQNHQEALKWGVKKLSVEILN